MGYAYDTDQIQICSSGTKLNRINIQDDDIILSMWTVNRLGLHEADIRGFSGGASDVDRCKLRSGWMQTGFVVSGYALLCTDVRRRIGNHSIVLIKKGWIPRAR